MKLFIDIETVPLYAHFDDMPVVFQEHWIKKCQYLRLTDEQQNDPQVAYRGRAGVYAEWSKVVCICLGYVSGEKNEIKTTAIANHDETILLHEFKAILSQCREKTEFVFCGHNIKEFDLPFICRRMTIHNMTLPDELDLAGVKPWQNQHVDTMELWRFGEYKRFTSLDLLAHLLGIDSPKAELDGSQVADVYYDENNLDKIVNYCLGDVETTAKVYFRLKGKRL